MFKLIFLMLLLFLSLTATANEVAIQQVVFSKQGEEWSVDTTLLHEDSGWDHYADAWRVLDEKGNELGQRVLFHPHEDEQPFTRSLQNLKIPAGLTIVFVEAHDKVHGWSKQKVRIDLTQKSGDKFIVRK